MPTKVLIADDHAIVREGLKRILADASDVEVIAEAETGAEALRRIREGGIDVVVLDISMPDRSGIDVLTQLRAEGRAVRVLVLSVYPESQYAVRVLRAGAAGFISKDAAPAQLLEAIRRIASGRRFISGEVAERLAASLSDRSSLPSHERLSEREFEVLRQLASGRTSTAIAKDLCISVKTVSTYKTRALRKMELSNDAELIRYALENEI